MSVANVIIRINPEAVGLPAKLAASECSTIFSLALDALRAADLENLPKIEGETLLIHMDIANFTDTQRRDGCNRRLAAMCISDLARGIRASMEAAAAHIEFRKVDMATLASSTEQGVMDAANAKLTELLAAAQTLSYPPLLDKVQAGLSSALQWAPELASFQRLRNCLEHRGGIVGERDVDEDGFLRLRLPFLDVGVLSEDGELSPIPFNTKLKKPVTIGARIGVRDREFALGEAVALPPNSIREIAMSVWLFADDLVTKLAPNSDDGAERH